MSSNPVPSPIAAVEPSIPGPVRQANTVTSIFLGPNGLRAGWRILIFMALFVAQGKVLNLVLHRIPAVAAMHKALPPDVMSPGVLMFDEGLSVALLLLTAFWMTLIEGRSFADYYLPPKEAFGKRFWQGVPYGFAMLTLLMAIIAALHGFSIQGLVYGWRGCAEVRAALRDRLLLRRHERGIPDARLHAVHARLRNRLLAFGDCAVDSFRPRPYWECR